MSGLAKMLAHHHDPGVYRWHAAFPADEVGARRRARRLAVRVRRRLAPPDPATSSWPRSARRWPSPSTTAQNLDALNDCLRDLPGRTGAAVGRLVHARPRGRDAPSTPSARSWPTTPAR